MTAAISTTARHKHRETFLVSDGCYSAHCRMVCVIRSLSSSWRNSSGPEILDMDHWRGLRVGGSVP